MTEPSGDQAPIPDWMLIPESTTQLYVSDFIAEAEKRIEDLDWVIPQLTENRSWLEAIRYKLTYQLDHFTSKYYEVDDNSSAERRCAAIEKWLSMEERNRRTNHRLLFEECDFGHTTSDRIMSFAKQVIRRVLGDSPPEDILNGGFTNGASTRVKRGPVAIAQKYLGEVHVSTSAIPYAVKLLKDDTMWGRFFEEGKSLLRTQESSVLFTVPKNSEIDRVACKEPELNMFMQRGVGNYIRAALRKEKIDLNDQTRNQRLAEEGSRGGKLATLDLSSASDLISTQLVYSLLPIDWFMLLDALRVQTVDVDLGDGTIYPHELSMFSSMGNGFTFELESLIFYALARAINRAVGVRGTVSVYGDDIITPVAAAAFYPRVFAWFGFKVNSKKSSWRGPFRESCGKHYWGGHDVTPFYLRTQMNSVSDLILTLNQMRAWATRDGDLDMFRDLWRKWAQRVPSYLHGGREVGSRLSLISSSRPRKELKVVTKKVEAVSEGALLHWLRENEKRTGNTARIFVNSLPSRVWLHSFWSSIEKQSIETSYGTTTVTYTCRRNRTWQRELSETLKWACGDDNGDPWVIPV